MATFNFNNQRTSFASGEVTPNIRAANDLERYKTGAEKIENLVVLIEGILTRRPGTRFILELKDETERGKMVPFRYSGSDYYMLAFNGGKMRVLKDQGFLESSPGTIYELTVPWLETDMENLRSAASGNVLLQVAAGNPPQKITRNGHTDWTIAEFQSDSGPIDTQNLDKLKVIRADALEGSVNLTAQGGVFDSGHVGGVFRLDELSQSLVPLWQADEDITVGTEAPSGATGTIGDMTSSSNAFDGVVNTAKATKASALFCYIGQQFSAPSSVLNAVVVISTSVLKDVTVEIYGSNVAPSSATDGTLLGNGVISNPQWNVDGSGTVTVTSNNASDSFLYLWIRFSCSVNFAWNVHEITWTRFAASSEPILRRWQRNIYQAISEGNTGANAPVHTEGDVLSGVAGVTWRFLYPGYGFVRIASVTDSNTAAGTVLSRLPTSIITNPTYRWWPPAWGDKGGWPDQVATHDQRAYFARDNTYWLTKPLTLDDFELTAFEDSAIARRLVAPDGAFVEIEWAVSSGILVQGSRDIEWLTRPPGDNDALTVLNVTDIPDQAEGSAPHIPALVDRGVIFIGRSRQRLHYCKFTRLAQELTIQEISVASRHMFGVGAVAMAWQRDPHRLLWIVLADGTLVCCTFMPDEKILGFHRHPMPGCFIEDIASLPTADNGRSDVYLQTRRTIDGETRRYYELLMPFFEPLDAAEPTAEGAWFVDCGLRYQGDPEDHITGLDHLIGETVAVFADGAEQTRKVVDDDGAIDLDAEASDVVVGLPIAWKMRDLPRDIVAQGQSTKGSPQRASRIIVDVRHAAGGQARFNDSEPENITETGAADYDAAIPLFTGAVPVILASETQEEGVLEVSGDNALPFTLLATTTLFEFNEAT